LNTQYLIIGQGLAGSALALTLLERGLPFHVIDHFDTGSSSRIAAGLINPVTGRNLVAGWKADELVPHAFQFYRNAEKLLGAKFLHDIPLVRIFRNAGEADRAKVSIEESPFLKELKSGEWPSAVFHTPHDAVAISPAGWLDTVAYLDAVRAFLSERGLLTDASVDWSALQPTKDEVTIAGITAEVVVCCEGAAAMHNPWFPNLPFSPTKGELLTIEAPELPQDCMVMKDHFLVPLGGGHFNLGATYNWGDLSLQTTPSALQALERSLREMTSAAYRVLNHRVGIRPSTRDRMPLLGRHPKHPRLALFTGLGSKGVSRAPWLAKHLLGHMENGVPILPEVEWTRKVKGHNQH
jgi:glycine/D-amino acid oxidase-like deaminating enzyme